uniref:Pro-opiomelanocortin/corticotropin ACTH central region domain-containing protein n=1 Tax=Neogobius melanostomus TaxID=47308 RepID=A0A8C6SMU8_9GOBI
MVSPSWLLVALMAHMCHSSRGSKCWDSPICGNLSNKHRILECIQMCMSERQDESPQINDVNDVDDPLDLVQNGLTSEDRSHSDERRSYSMEHFRWGKPSGRKRRPVKVFSSSLEGEGSSEGIVKRARRRLEVKRNGDAPPGACSKTPYKYSKQDPPATKRSGNFMKQWPDERPQSPLTKLLRNFMGKDIQRMAG